MPPRRQKPGEFLKMRIAVPGAAYEMGCVKNWATKMGQFEV